jgi:hypothetical protein
MIHHMMYRHNGLPPPFALQMVRMLRLQRQQYHIFEASLQQQAAQQQRLAARQPLQSGPISAWS